MNHCGAEGLWGWLGVMVGPDRGPRRAGIRLEGSAAQGSHREGMAAEPITPALLPVQAAELPS